jgi:DNA-cytosine methyltransferase
MNVLSLFDGISCGRVALDRAGIKVDKYYASEIDKYAIQIAQKNYPDTIQLGDINNWQNWDIDFAQIDLLCAGFPCQAWSVAGKQGGDTDPRGQLVHTLIAIWNHIKAQNPNLKFLFENVKMKKEFMEYINKLFGVEPIHINSALVSAQNRRRLYWTNIDSVLPEDKGVFLKDIVHENIVGDEFYFTDRIGESITGKNSLYKMGNSLRKGKEKARCLTAGGQAISNAGATNYYEVLNEYIVPFDQTLKILEKEVERGKVGYFRKDSQANRVYFIHDKAVTLCGDAGGGAAKMGQYLFGCIAPDRINENQNGQRFSEGKKFYTLTAQDKHGILIEGYIRKLTPIECERLQTLPDTYTEGVSNSQRYKALGNGWTVDVIAHILSFIK